MNELFILETVMVPVYINVHLWSDGDITIEGTECCAPDPAVPVYLMRDLVNLWEYFIETGPWTEQEWREDQGE